MSGTTPEPTNLTEMPDYTPDRVEGAQPRYMLVKLDAIIEPQLSARASMDEKAMQELIASMDELGQLEPVSLEHRGDAFEIITGHRRWFAARELNRHYERLKEVRWTCLKALVYEPGQIEILAARLHENIVREGLNPAEEAVFMRQAMEQYSLDLPGMARLFHRSEDYISGRFALLRGDPAVFNAVLEGAITLGAAHQLNRITEESARRFYLHQAKQWSPPGRVVEGWVREWAKNQQPMLQPQAAPAVEAAPPDAEAYRRECVLCGGWRDQGNLIEVVIHKYELEQILKQIEQAMKGGGNGSRD